jgi:hypothetical protein
MSTWIVNFMGEPSLHIRRQRRACLIDRPSIESTRVVTASDSPLLLVDIVDESSKFLARFTATHGLVLPATFHESARPAAVLRRRGTLPRNADRVAL